jgi:hypothetical protein
LRLTRSIFAFAALLLFAGQAHAFSIATASENGGDQTSARRSNAR